MKPFTGSDKNRFIIAFSNLTNWIFNVTDPKNPTIIAYVYDQKYGYSNNDFSIIQF